MIVSSANDFSEYFETGTRTNADGESKDQFSTQDPVTTSDDDPMDIT